jgi:hypothetical protein
MDLKQYVSDACRTESKVEFVKADPQFLAGVLQIFIAAGTMLDQIKKNVYYEKPINLEETKAEFLNIVTSLDMIQPVIVDGPQRGPIDVDPRIFHSLIGLATESTELVEALSVAFSGEELDNINLLEEFGDINWYQAIGIDALGGDFGSILKTNIDKLKKRYPERFTNEDALERDLDVERKTLEDGLEAGC